MSDLSPSKLILLLLVALLLFGAKRLPEIGKSLGTGMREFKDSVSGTTTKPTTTELPVPTPEAMSAAPLVPALPHEHDSV